MIRKTKNLEKNYPPRRIYLEDLLEIEKILKNSNHDIRIRTEDYIANTISEISEVCKDKTLNELTISTIDFRLRIHLGSSSATLEATSYTSNDTGIFHEIDDVLSKAKEAPFSVSSINFLATAIILGITYSLFNYNFSSNLLTYINMYVLIIILIFTYYRGSHYSTIVFSNKTNNYKLYDYKREIITLLITFILTKILEYIFKV